jgi:hypothetical protein
MQDYNQAFAYVAALTQADPQSTLIDVRLIHDQRKDVPAIPLRGTLPDLWSTICSYNSQGYGAFVNIADMDGHGRETANVRATRVAVADLDNMSAVQNLERASQMYPPATFGVETSPNKFHAYWCTPYYLANDHYTLRQRKLRQLLDGDRTVIDPARVLRLPGTLHQKGEPFLVRCFAMPGYGQIVSHEAIDGALQSINVIDGGSGNRHDLGDPELAAPSMEWLKRSLTLVDPNELDRSEWMGMTYAFKQAGWSLTDPQTLMQIWLDWCALYTKPPGNDVGENIKQWSSIKSTELGWPSLLRRVPSLQAQITFGNVQHAAPSTQAVPGMPPVATSAPAMPEPPPLDCSGEYLTHNEQKEWFKGCIYIVNRGDMLTLDGRYLNSNQFNVAFGGKKFIIDSTGKMVNEAWQAATRSTMWQVPKVDHIRFVPTAGYHEILTDDLGRTGVNVYKPIVIKRTVGDASPFLNHIAALLPSPSDQKLLIEYLAHNAKFPGHKIPWAPVIQSAEGAGKGVIKAVVKAAMGKPYVYFPKAAELAKSGAQFNAWLRNKLFILVDEVRVDERRELIEVLKPLISEEEAEVQAKGIDQDLEDNFSNWCFFTNWKDAIPVSKNGRRFAIMYSALQTADDLIARGMNEDYFNWLYDWLAGDGAAIVADYLLSYPIERGKVPMRAPATSSTGAAIELSRSPIERVILEAVEDGLQGFRGGWISGTAVAKRIKDAGAVRGGQAQPQTIATVLENMGYVACGRTPTIIFQEDPMHRPYVFFKGQAVDAVYYAASQGWAGI